jgi:ferredoxin-NADP reductase
VRVITSLSRETADGFWHGRLDDAALAKAIAGEYGNTTYMSCGPQAIMDLTVAHMTKHGVPAERIKTESFES